MEEFSGLNALAVQQKKEWGEILTGFEGLNKYAVMSPSGEMLFSAVEEPGSLLARLFLKAMRPFTVNLRSLKDQTVVLRISRPFRFYFHEVNIFSGQGQLLGTVKKRFSFLRRIYSVYDASGSEFCQLFGPILHPWTFEIRDSAGVHGKITKKWSGLAKEAFTDADNFGVEFPAEWDPKLKAVFLGAVFLIDFVHFENTGNNRN